MAELHSKKELRGLIDFILKVDSELDAFVLDNFEITYRMYSDGMDRVKKVNLLLLRESSQDVFRALYESHKNLIENYCSKFCDTSKDKNIHETWQTQAEYSITIKAEIRQFNNRLKYDFLNRLRDITYDFRLTIKKVTYGSVVFWLRGTKRGYNKIHEEYTTGKLTSIDGFQIEQIRLGRVRSKLSLLLGFIRDLLWYRLNYRRVNSAFLVLFLVFCGLLTIKIMRLSPGERADLARRVERDLKILVGSSSSGGPGGIQVAPASVPAPTPVPVP